MLCPPAACWTMIAPSPNFAMRPKNSSKLIMHKSDPEHIVPTTKMFLGGGREAMNAAMLVKNTANHNVFNERS